MFRFLTAGESHGKDLTVIVEGIPAGLSVNIDNINRDLAARQKGYGRGGRMKIETDKAEVTSGIRFGKTIGSPITFVIHNRDFQNWIEKMSYFGEEFGKKLTNPRPGHADLVGVKKYDLDDVRNILERSSARETASRVCVGSLCKEFLAALDIKIVSHVTKIGGVSLDLDSIDYKNLETPQNDLAVLTDSAYEKMVEKIKIAQRNGDTLGGDFEVVIKNLPIGLGSHIQWDRRLDGKIAQAMMSIQAIKSVEIGAGKLCGELFGSEIHDEIFFDENRGIYRKTNRAGGLEGGMTNGEPVIVRATMKPIPTLMKPLSSISIETNEEVLANKERSDTCAVSAASKVGEAMMAIVITSAILEKFGCDNMGDLKANIKYYNERIGIKNEK